MKTPINHFTQENTNKLDGFLSQKHMSPKTMYGSDHSCEVWSKSGH
jgi:hypothetical protein